MIHVAELPPPQSFVRYGSEIRTYQDRSLELHGYATSFCRSIRRFLAAANPGWFEAYGNISTRDFLMPGETFITTCQRFS